MNIDQRINSLLKAAARHTDPDTLREIADKLERLGAWEQAQAIYRKAEQMERWYADLEGQKG